MVEDGRLQRFLDAQHKDFLTALTEVKNGKKRSHWMWYIFPQLKGLGHSEISRYYALNDRYEAAAYLRHPLLGGRLISICNELLKLNTNDAYSIFGSPDDLKLRSCMTLFALLPDTDVVFEAVLNKFFTGNKDERTIRLLNTEG